MSGSTGRGDDDAQLAHSRFRAHIACMCVRSSIVGFCGEGRQHRSLIASLYPITPPYETLLE